MKGGNTFNKKTTVVLNPFNNEYKSFKTIGKNIKISDDCHNNIGQEIYIMLFGNIYNWRSFSLENTDTPENVIINLYITYGMEYTLQILDGVFSIILLDQRYDFGKSTLYVSCDPIGLFPIYFTKQYESMYVISNKTENNYTNFKPGTFSTFTLSNIVITNWELSLTTTYSVLGKSGNCPIQCIKESISNTFKEILRELIIKYIDCAKHIICIIEPNNVESEFIAEVCLGRDVETYSIICDNDTPSSEHTNVYIQGNVSEQKKMEYLASSIRENYNEKEDIVVFMGIGINFLKEYDDEPQDDFSLREIIKNIHKYLGNTIIEPFHTENLNIVFPLLDKSWVDFYLSIPPEIRDIDKQLFEKSV